MSEKALVTRAWKIRNPAKLASFVAALEQHGGLPEALGQAHAALAKLVAEGGG